MALNDMKLCQGKDVFERMNFLYQASLLVSSSNKVAASYYGNLMVSCAKKAVLRMEPDIKRTICKVCHSPLIAGETARIRLVSRPVKAVKWTCLRCKATRRISTKKDYNLWSDKPESVVQVFDYTPQTKNALPDIIPQKTMVDKSEPIQLVTAEEKKLDSTVSVAQEDKS